MSSSRLRRRGRRAAPGFSLIELTLVVVILGVLMAVVAVNVLGQGERAKKRATEVSMDTIQTQLDSYHLEYSAYPPTLQTLQQLKFLKETKPLQDGWSREFYYKVPGAQTPYELISAGADGEFLTADDIDIWKAQQQ